MKTLIALSLAALSLTATAADKPAETKQTPMEYCAAIELIAGLTMDSYQVGVPAMKMYESASKTGDKTFTLMVDEVLDTPRFATKDNQKRASRDFANKWAALCMKVVKDGK
ncbi:MAG: hypothetical protein ACRC3K_07520 [Plesiomonas sp.]